MVFAVILFVVLFFLGVYSLTVGAVNIDFDSILNIFKGQAVENKSWSFIIENRLSRTLVAILAGAALSVAGLILQIFFRNPLAGPGVLGISSGATLGVALVVLGGVTISGFTSNLTLVVSGVIGAVFILMLLMVLSKFVRNMSTLLIVGLMLSYFTSAFVNALYHWADKDESRQFIVWGLGSFEDVPIFQVTIIGISIVLSLLTVLLIVKPLNAMTIGEAYAQSMGVNLRITKTIIILVSSILTAVVTVYCGPIAFIGIAIPQLVRALSKSNSFLNSFILSILMGSVFALLADLFLRLSGNILPLNTITSIVGAPIIIWTIVNMNMSKQKH
jgi:iron complex transport system permease protein